MDDKRRKCQGPIHIGSILNSTLRTLQEQTDGELARVWRIWDEAVGEAVASAARPAAFKGRLLYVNVSSSPWLHQLQFLKKDIVSNLNKALGRNVVEDVKFKIGL
jgi:predicted nucleic acid-binding Zn ribbon protein